MRPCDSAKCVNNYHDRQSLSVACAMQRWKQLTSWSVQRRKQMTSWSVQRVHKYCDGEEQDSKVTHRRDTKPRGRGSRKTPTLEEMVLTLSYGG